MAICPKMVPVDQLLDAAGHLAYANLIRRAMVPNQARS
jgi:hypothetical protein